MLVTSIVFLVCRRNFAFLFKLQRAKFVNCRPSKFLAVVLRFAFVGETVCWATSAHMSFEQLQAAPALDKRSFRPSGVRRHFSGPFFLAAEHPTEHTAAL